MMIVTSGKTKFTDQLDKNKNGKCWSCWRPQCNFVAQFYL